MSDFRRDPDFSQGTQEYDNRVQWAAVAVILLLVGGLIVAASFTDTQTANGPAIETTGSGATGSTATRPPSRPMKP